MLSIVATPIGNLEDISLRALRVLKEADVIIAEDTRHTGLLLKHYKISHKPMVSLYDEVERQKVSELVSLVAGDQKVVLVSDAGTPLISDPGYKLVREAIANGVKVEAVPGPNAAITALILSGLPPDKFLFLGYPPEKESHQQQILDGLPKNVTVIFYVAPHKLLRFLKLVDGNQEIVVARELTKVYEEIWRGKASDTMIKFAKPQGEFVVLWHN